MKLIDKDALLTEIDRIENGLMDSQGNFAYKEDEGVYHTLCSLENFINSLEVKEVQEEPVSEVEKAAKRYATEGDEISGLYIIDEEVDAFKAGAKWQKEQMLKKSFGATVCKYLNTFLKEMDKDAISQTLREYTNGDRVRVLIIKQEQL